MSAHEPPRAPFQVEVVTLVPGVWPVILGDAAGLVGRAFVDGLATLAVNPLRQYGKGKHQQVDDAPFGGGAGMVLAAPPVSEAIAVARARTPGPVILLTPRGETFNQARARRLASGPGLTLICGRYEGIDERVRDLVDLQLSVGDVVLSGGDPAAFCVIDAVVRLLPGVLGNSESLAEESFAAGLLEYPQYTRPASFAGHEVPEVLRSGDHAAVARWRKSQALAITRRLRPDLVEDD
jgi:tRNA (guanine37-N1)-methyltransferase